MSRKRSQASKDTSKKININKDIVDPFNRYKMDQLQISHLAKKRSTTLENIEAISKQLKRTPEELMKYLGVKLCTSVKIKSGVHNINGIHAQKDVQSHLYSYIDKFVLCKKCSNPQTECYPAREKREKIVIQHCRACSHCERIDVPPLKAEFQTVIKMIMTKPVVMTNHVETKNSEQKTTSAFESNDDDSGLSDNEHADDYSDGDFSDEDCSEAAQEARRNELMGGFKC